MSSDPTCTTYSPSYFLGHLTAFQSLSYLTWKTGIMVYTTQGCDNELARGYEALTSLWVGIYKWYLSIRQVAGRQITFPFILHLLVTPYWQLLSRFTTNNRCLKCSSPALPFFYWSIIALQCCISFCYKKVNQVCAYGYPLPPDPPPHLPHPTCRPSQSAGLTSLYLRQLPTSYQFYTW